MSAEKPHTYAGAPLVVKRDGHPDVDVELAHRKDDVEFSFEVPDPTWGNRHATRACYLMFSRADWEAIVRHVAEEHERFAPDGGA